MRKGMLVDVSKCIACRSCQIACKQWWKLPAVPSINRGTHENPPDLTAHTWNKIGFKEIENDGKKRWLFTRKACMHCSQAVCVWVCPSYARGYSDQGFVAIDQDRCIGCGRCAEYCPFQVPKLGQHDVSRKISVGLYTPRLVSYSCAFCKDRLEKGAVPACAKSCPTQAIRFGELPDLIRWGEARVNTVKASHPKANLYGKKELHGLKVIYVLTEEPGTHGLPQNPQVGTYPAFVKHTFPRWYGKAMAGGVLPVFPPKANPEWYMQPDLVPAPSPEEPLMIADFAGPRIGRWAPVLWGWFSLGVMGTFVALLIKLRGRRASDGAKEENGQP